MIFAFSFARLNLMRAVAEGSRENKEVERVF